ncbi:GreA/GreB family elongation factor [Lacihabitans lacunae]|uniref:GreA/GreB family elongation factor n=1 Tax=Lacihabitans lacunae TaxID=1028214 RepID=A0ABV7YSG4_9BACT
MTAMTDKIYMTLEGQTELRKRIITEENNLKALLKEKAVAYEASGDGWHDNPGWIQIGQQEERISKDINEMKKRLRDAIIIKNNAESLTSVQIGSKVRLKQECKGIVKELILDIVGNQESNLAKGKIAYDTPLGSAIIGAKVGELVNLKAPIGIIKIEILELLHTNETI